MCPTKSHQNALKQLQKPLVQHDATRGRQSSWRLAAPQQQFKYGAVVLSETVETTKNIKTTKTISTNRIRTKYVEPSEHVHSLQRRHFLRATPCFSTAKRCLCVWRSQLLCTVGRVMPTGYLQSSTISSKTKTTNAMRHIPTTAHSTTRHHTPNAKNSLRRSPALVLLSTLFLLWFSHLVGSTCAAPQSCVLCDINDLKAKEPNANSYEEYRFEHQVTRVDAIMALRTLNASYYGGPSGCAISCTDKVMKYCLGPQFINDHCWCELGHTDEGLPFVPHICYVGEKLYKASVGSCYFYEEVKECCCAPALAKQWRHISASTRPTQTCSILLLSILSLIFIAPLANKRISQL